MLKGFAIVTVSAEQDSVLVLPVKAFEWHNSILIKKLLCRFLMLFWELYKESYQKDCVVLEVISTLGKFVHSANFKVGALTEPQTPNIFLKFFKLRRLLWALEDVKFFYGTVKYRQQFSELQFPLAMALSRSQVSLYGVKAIDLSYNSAKVTPAVVQHPSDSVKHSVFHTSHQTAVWQS